MAFCANCGAKVGDSDKFCASCGATRVPGAPQSQPVPPPPPVYQAPVQPQGTPPSVYSSAPASHVPPMAGTSGESSTGLKVNIAGLLCYLGAWVTGIIFLIIEKKSQFVRFHAAQSVVVFGTITVLNILLSIIFSHFWFFGTFLNGLLGLLAFILWVVLMYKAYQGETYKIPILGDIASGIAGKV